MGVEDGDGCWLAPRGWVTMVSTGAGCFRNRSVIKWLEEVDVLAVPPETY